jgi:methyl-accepting chemotaxis protein
MTGRIEAISGAVGQIATAATRMQDDVAEVAAVAEQSSASTEQVTRSKSRRRRSRRPRLRSRSRPPPSS